MDGLAFDLRVDDEHVDPAIAEPKLEFRREPRRCRRSVFDHVPGFHQKVDVTAALRVIHPRPEQVNARISAEHLFGGFVDRFYLLIG